MQLLTPWQGQQVISDRSADQLGQEGLPVPQEGLFLQPFDQQTVSKEIERKSFNRVTFTCNDLRAYTEDHLWLYPTFRGDDTFYCGLTGMWYTVRGSGYQLFDTMEMPHWIISFPVGETLMDERAYVVYCNKLLEAEDEWKKSAYQYRYEQENRKRFISNI